MAARTFCPGFLYGVYVDDGAGHFAFHANKAPTTEQLTEVLHTIPTYIPSMAITWMQRLKRVFNIDIETCEKCKGPVKIIACVEDPVLIKKILKHLNAKAISNNSAQLPPGRGPPQIGLFDFN